MDYDAIKGAFVALSGLSEEEAEQQKALLLCAGQAVENRLSPQAQTDGAEELLTELAAVNAWQDYLLSRQSAQPKKVSTPDVTVEYDLSAQIAAAKALYERLCDSLRAYTEDGFSILLA